MHSKGGIIHPCTSELHCDFKCCVESAEGQKSKVVSFFVVFFCLLFCFGVLGFFFFWCLFVSLFVCFVERER